MKWLVLIYVLPVTLLSVISPIYTEHDSFRDWLIVSPIFGVWYLGLSTAFLVFDLNYIHSTAYEKSGYGVRMSPSIIRAELSGIVKTVLVNLVHTFVVGLCLTYYFRDWKSPLINWPPVFKLLVTWLCEEIWMYYSHRALHTPYLYRYHKLHHTYRQPIAFTGLYCSVAEMYITNMPLLMAGPFLTSMNLEMHIFWGLLLATHVCNNHSGHSVTPTSVGDAQLHDIHHQYPHRRFGAVILDRLHGTL